MLLVLILGEPFSIEMVNKKKTHAFTRNSPPLVFTLEQGRKKLMAQQQSKSEIRRPAAFIFSLLYIYIYAHGGGCILSSSKFVLCLYTRRGRSHYFSDSAARQEQEAALRSGASGAARRRIRADVLRSAAST